MNSLQEEVKKLTEQSSAVSSSSDEFEELRKRAEIAERMAKVASSEVQAPVIVCRWDDARFKWYRQRKGEIILRSTCAVH